MPAREREEAIRLAERQYGKSFGAVWGSRSEERIDAIGSSLRLPFKLF